MDIFFLFNIWSFTTNKNCPTSKIWPKQVFFAQKLNKPLTIGSKISCSGENSPNPVHCSNDCKHLSIFRSLNGKEPRSWWPETAWATWRPSAPTFPLTSTRVAGPRPTTSSSASTPSTWSKRLTHSGENNFSKLYLK